MKTKNYAKNNKFLLKGRAVGRIRQLSFTNPLNSQLDTNVQKTTLLKKWNDKDLLLVLLI